MADASTFEDFIDNEELDCALVCNNNTDDDNNFQFDEDRVRLNFLTHSVYNAAWVKDITRRFEIFKQGAVEIDFGFVSSNALNEAIINAAEGQLSLFAGFVAPATLAGNIVEYDGWADLTAYIQESTEHTADWTDILFGYRKYVAQYNNKIIMFPLDGDLLSLYYRKDVLKHFGLKVPRTWDEYNEVAAATHGQVFENQTLTGSCIGRNSYCGGGAYWANLLISSITQSGGRFSGHLFDVTDMSPLTTEAVLQQVLQWLEEQVKYGPSDELERCYGEINIGTMLAGKCVLTYNWGDSFKWYLQGDKLRGRFGVAPTPGSKQILDRETGELVDCNEKNCRYGKEYDGIGWVNHAPYLAFGGWACAVNNYTDTVQKRLATEFCAFASSRGESIKNIIQNATGSQGFNGQDPFRESHLNESLYVSQGYEEETVKEYIDVIRSTLSSPNVVTDIRFPMAFETYEVLNLEFHMHLNATKYGLVPLSLRESARAEVATRINNKWRGIISSYDALGSTQVPILEVYQKLRGVFVPDIDYNYIHKLRWYGYTLAIITIVVPLLFAAWSILYRKAPVVRASQPVFLVMICFGALVVGSAIFPLGIDDGIASVDACSKACMSIPWLLALGWTILFSALYAKLRRVNMVFRNAAIFRRVTVTHQDVLLPFVILLTGNISVLLTWTLVDPMQWKRVNISPTESYGSCEAEGDTWKICVVLVVLFNFVALIMANVEAFRARHIQVEYGESKYIGLTMASFLQICLVGVPLLFLEFDNPSASYFVQSTLVFCVSMSCLLFLFVPKLWVWSRKPGEKIPGGGNSSTTELAFRSQNTVGSMQSQAQLSSVLSKIADLEEILNAEGIATEEFFDNVGLRSRHAGLSPIREEANTRTVTHDGPSLEEGSLSADMRESDKSSPYSEGDLATVGREEVAL